MPIFVPSVAKQKMP